ncbi:MAG: caspase family protein [Desulfobacterales bacterium]|nr:caspase family protein [Desulfobacterales bacterium]
MKKLYYILIIFIIFVKHAFGIEEDNFSLKFNSELQGHNKTISSLMFSPSSKLLASGDNYGNIIIWDINEVKLLNKLSEHKKQINALSFSPDEKYLFSGGNDKKIIMWNLESAQIFKTFILNQVVKCIAISYDSKKLIAGGKDGKIAIWDIISGKEIKILEEAHENAVLFVGFTGDESFRTVGEDRKMKFWEINKSRPIATSIDEFASELNVVVSDPEISSWALGATVVRTEKFHAGIKTWHNIYLKDGSNWADAGTLKGHEYTIRSLSFSPDARYLASAGDGKTLNVWNVEKGRIAVDIKCNSIIYAMHFSLDGEWFAMGDNNIVSLYKVKGVSIVKKVPEFLITAEPDPTPGEKYAIIIGISKYKDKNINSLTYTVTDAQAIYDFLISKKGGFSKDKIRLLLDYNATKVNIEDALKNYLPRNAGKESMALVFFAGHGTPETDLSGYSDDGSEKYIVPYDADLTKISATCFAMSEFSKVFSSIRAKRVIFFIDSCFSGGGAGKEFLPDVLQRTFSSNNKGFRGIIVTSKFLKNLVECPQGYGKVLVTASQANETALELPILKHGIFTYFLLEGLEGKADINNDELVTLSEVYDYLEDKVATLSRKEGGKQTPMMIGSVTGKIIMSTLNTK